MNARNRQRRYRGAALAEMALVLTILLMVTLGALQYGWAFYCLQRATNAARHAARVQAVADPPEKGTTETQVEAWIADIEGDCSFPTATDPNMVTAQVEIPQSKSRLIDWNLLPVPALRATVTMHLETP